MNDIMRIVQLIQNATNVAIISHINMDGDAIGSSLGLMLALRKMGKCAVTYIEEDIPDRFDFWKDIDGVVMYDETCDKVHDLLVVVDVADKKLLGKRERMLQEIPTNVSVDHHALHFAYSNNSYVRADAAAAGEIVYDIVERMGVDMDLDIATCLYVAISTDTGRFKFDSTTPTTHMIASKLLTYGVDSNWLSNKVFDESSKERTRLIAEAIFTLNMYCDDRIAVMHITRDMINKVGAKDSDVEGIIDFAINIRGVDIGVVIREKADGTLKASIRSKSSVDVAEIASRFGGGGHKKASGCTYDGDLMQFKRELVECIRGEM